MTGWALIAIAVLGVAYATLVLRAAPGRRDNQLFFAIAILDVAMVAWRGAQVLTGHRLVDPSCLTACSVGTTLLATLCVEFLWSFPSQRPMPWSLRGLLVAMAIGASALMIATPRETPWRLVVSYGYFLPITAIICTVGVRAWRRTRTVGVRLIVGALLFRWVYGFFAYMVGELTGTLEQLLWIETTAAVLVSFVVIGHAILRDELFRVRGAMAEALGATIFGTLIVASTFGAIHAVLAYASAGAEQELGLLACAMIPLALVSIGRVLYPRIETGVLASLDDRRALRLELSEPLSEDPDRAIAQGIERLLRMTGGGDVKYLPAEALPGPLPEPELRGHALGELVIAVRGAGAFVLTGGAIDRDTLLVARQVARDAGHALEHRRMLEELEGTKRLAALGQFAAAIAHDIRTPLTSVSMNVQILRRKAQLPPSDMEYFDIALDELGRLERSIAQILDYAKPVRLDEAPVDVRELVDDAAKSLATVVANRGVVLRAEHEGGLPPIAGDAQRLRQVLTNLVDNASVASSDGDAVTLRTRREDGHVVIDVEDRGRGIRAEDLGKIFEPFFTTRPDGTGLGLAICQKLVRAHGGELRVRSREGSGSTFSVVLPASS
ncbi:MAG TPA: ATP-binding protein [Kofleriaceae bacterium]|nr:ATP-binding protein [Kofleriaceae bacterium]